MTDFPEQTQTDEELQYIVKYIKENSPESKKEFNQLKNEACKELQVDPPANRFLFREYRDLLDEGEIEQDNRLEAYMTKAEVRTISGIAIITSLCKPYPCPAECVFCPTENKMPKSYHADEPAAARALRLEFSPYIQMQNRIKVLEDNGHNTDKIEFIIKGGTWHSYPIKYQYWFIMESFKACNNLKRDNPKEKTQLEDWDNLEALKQELQEEQNYNETADHRIIGLTVETRPDTIAPKTIKQLREQGCTRVELGLQATDNEILRHVKRGHTVEDFRESIYLLRQAGFKVDFHFMPDLPGTTPQKDVEMYRKIFSDPGLKPDMIKIYPCVVMESAELYEWYKSGRYSSYGTEALFDALLQMKKDTPKYCRITRLIRDFPSDEIEGGNEINNLRQSLQRELKEQGETCDCIRCREIGRQRDKLDDDVEPEIFVEQLDTRGGDEYFISIEDPDRIAIFGFLRLRLPKKDEEHITEVLPHLKGCAFIRELHVYGTMAKIGEKDKAKAQHKGFGTALMNKAEEIIEKNGFEKAAVISGVGVRKYYENLGYKQEGTYMTKEF
ncbi:MAG: elongator complex protein 3 [Candidatus Paceibacteria bacterium]